MLHKGANHRSLILQSSSQRLAQSGEVLVALGRIAMHLYEVVLTAVSCLRSSAMHCMNRRSEHRSDDADEALCSSALDEFQICGVNLGFNAYALRTEGSERADDYFLQANATNAAIDSRPRPRLFRIACVCATMLSYPR